MSNFGSFESEHTTLGAAEKKSDRMQRADIKANEGTPYNHYDVFELKRVYSPKRTMPRVKKCKTCHQHIEPKEP